VKYLLTASYEFESDDDPAARAHIRDLLQQGFCIKENNETKIKLRCLYENKQPRAISLYPLHNDGLTHDLTS